MESPGAEPDEETDIPSILETDDDEEGNKSSPGQPTVSEDLQDAGSAVGASAEDGDRDTSDPRLTCPICLCDVHQPVATRCGHVLCFECLEGWTRTRDTSHIACPICRARLSLAKDIIPLFLPSGGSSSGWDHAQSDEAKAFKERFQTLVQQHSRRRSRAVAAAAAAAEGLRGHMDNRVFGFHTWGGPNISVSFGTLGFGRALYLLEQDLARLVADGRGASARAHRHHGHTHTAETGQEGDAEGEAERRSRRRATLLHLVCYFVLVLCSMLEPLLRMMATRSK